jgi:hypothetical protein
LTGVLAINTAALVGCLVLARRRGGLVLTVIVAFVLAAMVRGFGAAFLFHTWNPDMPAFPTAFLILATWSVIEGDLRLLPLVVAVSCFAWQAHLGYLPVTGGLAFIALAGAAVHLARRRWSGPGQPPGPRSAGRSPWVAIGVTAVTALVCLAPLVVEQATNDPGNLRLIYNSFRHPKEEVAGFANAARVSAKHLVPYGTWISGDDAAEPLSGRAAGGSPALLVFPLAALAAAAVAAWRTKAIGALRFLGVTATGAGLAFISVARTTGETYNYLFNWFRPVSALVWASVAWAAFEAVRRSSWSPTLDRPPVRYLAATLTALMIVALSVSSLTNGVGLEFQEDGASLGVQALAPGTLAAVAGQERVYLLSLGGWCAGELGNGLAVQMVEHGTEVAVTDALGTAYGRQRVRHDVVPTVQLICGPVAKDAIAKLPIRPVATNSILSDSEEAELAALQERFRDQLRRSGHDELLKAVDSEAMERVFQTSPSDTHFDTHDVDRFTYLMDRAQASAAVFFRPFGPNDPW